MNNLNKTFCNKHLLKSPWLNPRLDSLLNTEFELCEYAKDEPSVKVNATINWVHQMGNETALRVALAKYAPLVRLDHPTAETWISQPSSLSGNTTVIVCGFDFDGTLRTAGGNWCSRPRRPNSAELSAPEFFERFDRCTRDLGKIDLLQETLNICASRKSTSCSDGVHYECERFRVRPIHLIVLTNDRPLWTTFPAVVHGEYFRDVSLEAVGGL